MKILFVCKYNKFRSKIAEAYFNKVNKNKRIKARSAGIIRGSVINDEIVNAASKFGITIDPKKNPKPLTTKLLKWQDMLIIVADDIPRELFSNVESVKKLVMWQIPDITLNDGDGISRSINMIIEQVDKLIKELEEKK